jgi:uncharacterized protein
VSTVAILLALPVGVLVGLLSGLLGIGGGIVMVPFLYLLLAGPLWSGIVAAPEHHATIAHATSLFVIVPTALAGLMTYRRDGVVTLREVLPLGVAAAGAALVGSQVAVLLPSEGLKAAFGLFLLIMGLRLGQPTKASKDSVVLPERTLSPVAALAGGSGVGFLSALLGVGGGIVAIPILIRWAGMGLHRVAAASIGIVTFAATAGTVGYIVGGMRVEGLPAGSLGLVHLPVGLALLPGAILLAPVGARLNQRLPVPVLRRIFAVVLLVVGIRLVWVNGGALVFGG